jgi:histidyl-tRNA synthetase
MDTPPKLSTDPYKGVRDFYPPDMRRLKGIFAAWRKAVEAYGYEEYGASPLEPTELYLSKTSEEIVREQTYSFTDRGDREVTLRPEMTPTVARMLAGRLRETPMPARWYSIPNVFRYERPQKGRLREHFQLNVDVFGLDAPHAEVELILIARRIMREMKIPDSAYVIKLNSRTALKAGLEKAGFDESIGKEVIRLIDRKEKISDFTEQLEKLAPGFVLDTNEPDDVAVVRNFLKQQEVTNVEFDPYLARGFDYYTGVVFEIFATDPEHKRSLFGGGRYDGLTKLFGAQEVAAAGFGMGDVTALDLQTAFASSHELPTETDLHVCLTGEVANGRIIDLVEKWRDTGLNVSIDWSGKKIGDQLKYADKRTIPFICVVGTEEFDKQTLSLKRMSDGKTVECSLADVPATLATLRS